MHSHRRQPGEEQFSKIDTRHLDRRATDTKSSKTRPCPSIDAGWQQGSLRHADNSASIARVSASFFPRLRFFDSRAGVSCQSSPSVGHSTPGRSLVVPTPTDLRNPAMPEHGRPISVPHAATQGHLPANPRVARCLRCGFGFFRRLRPSSPGYDRIRPSTDENLELLRSG